MKYTQYEKDMASDFEDERKEIEGTIKDIQKEIKSLTLELNEYQNDLAKIKTTLSTKEILKMNRDKIKNFLEENDVKATDENIEKLLNDYLIIEGFDKNEWNFKSSLVYVYKQPTELHIDFTIAAIKGKDLFYESHDDFIYEIKGTTICAKTDGGRLVSILDFSKDLENKGFSEKEIKKFEGRVFKKIIKEFRITKSTKIPQRYKKYFLLLG